MTERKISEPQPDKTLEQRAQKIMDKIRGPRDQKRFPDNPNSRFAVGRVDRKPGNIPGAKSK